MFRKIRFYISEYFKPFKVYFYGLKLYDEGDIMIDTDGKKYKVLKYDEVEKSYLLKRKFI